MNFSSMFNGGFPGAAAPNGFSGVFPMGRTPVRPNPLMNPGQHGTHKANVSGIQEAMAKRGEKDDKPKGFKYDTETGLTGEPALNSIKRYMKSAGLNDFQTSFFSRLVASGLSESQINQCVKRAGQQFGNDVEIELKDGLEKIAFAAAVKPLLKPVGAGIASGISKGIGAAGNFFKNKVPAATKAVTGSRPVQAASRGTKAVVGGAKAVANTRPAGMAGRTVRNLAPAAAGAATQLAVGDHLADRVSNTGMDYMDRTIHGFTDPESGQYYGGLTDDFQNQLGQFTDSMSSKMDGINNTLADQGNQLRSQLTGGKGLSSLLGGLSGAVGGAGNSMGQMAGSAMNYVKQNPWLLPLLIGGAGAAGGGMLGGRTGAAMGGIGLPLAYLAANGQLGNLQGLLSGQQNTQQPQQPAPASPPVTVPAPVQAKQQYADDINRLLYGNGQTVPTRNELQANQ